MFQLVLNSIQKTINVVAPPMVEEVEFKYHCQTIKEYFSNEQNLEEINTKVVEDTQVPKHMNGLMRLLLEDNERLFLSNVNLSNSGDHNRAGGSANGTCESNLGNAADNTTRSNQETVSASIEELNPTLSVSDRSPAGHRPEIIDQAILNTEITISTFMETLLSEKILEIIIDAAKYDLPVGIRMHCYKFLARLLKDYKVNLLNHCSILNQINELISLCATNVAGPYEQSQIELLSVIINKIQLNYNLINCFSRNDFPLLNSLIVMLSSPDNEIADKAGQLLIELVSIAEEDVVKIILGRTPFKKKMIENLANHYKQIPSTINPEDIQTVISLQESNQSLNDSLPSLSYQIRKFLIFFKWFSFLDQVLCKCKSSNLASQLLEVFKTDFLVKSLSTKLFLSEELNQQILSTILTFACLKNCKSSPLKESIIDYLFDEKDLIKQISECSVDDLADQFGNELSGQLSNQIGVIEQNQQPNDSAQPTDKNEDKASETCRPALNKRKRLIDRCRIWISENVDHQFLFRLNLNDRTEQEIYNRYLLNLYSLQLLEEILNKTTKSLFEELFVRNLMKRTYLDINRYNICNDLNELDELNKISDVELHLPDDEPANEQTESSSSPFNIEAIKSIKFFVALIPNELKSCSNDFGYLDFEPYIEEAQKRFDECLLVCEHWGWSKEVVDNFFLAIQDQQSAEFVESDFMAMLFDNLSSIIQTPYEINLQITSLITKIALFPHPNLNEYLLNPGLPLKENCRSLFSILHRIVECLQIQVKGVKQLKIKLSVIRTFLLGESTDLNGYDISNQDQKILEAIIIVEEFCKELASVGFVKNTYLV